VELKHGLIVIDKEGNIRHFVGYEEPPTDIDKHSVFDELFDEFGEEIFDMKIEDAPPDIIKYMINMLREHGAL